MADIFHINISTPAALLFDGEIKSLVAPGELGYLGILANHADLITTLVPGRISVRGGSGKSAIIDSTGSGFLEVSKNNAVLVLDSAKVRQ